MAVLLESLAQNVPVDAVVFVAPAFMSSSAAVTVELIMGQSCRLSSVPLQPNTVNASSVIIVRSSACTV